MTRLTDYGIVLLTHMAKHPEKLTQNAPELAAEAHLPLPTVSKVLKILAREGFLVPHRGAKGGFSLARSPENISVSEIIAAFEGPIALTECSAHDSRRCVIERRCPVGANWQVINRAVHDALERLTLSDMLHPLSPSYMLAARA